MVMVSQMVAVVVQTQKRIQVCDLSSLLRSLIFYGRCYTWKACKESQRERGKDSGVEGLPDELAYAS